VVLQREKRISCELLILVLLFAVEFACTYKNPEEEGDLKRILEKDEVDQVQDDFWPSKPKVFI